MAPGTAEADIEVSIVIPVYDEEESLVPLWSRLRNTAERLGRSWEVVFVDDGSRDASLDRLLALRKGDRRVRIVRLRENSGQSAALDAGFRVARGEWIVTLDADLQNPPEEISKLLDASAGIDMVYGRRARRHDTMMTRIASRVGNGVRNAITGHAVRDTGCSLKAFRRSALAKIPCFRGMHRFLPSLFAFHGFRIREVDVAHAERHAGTSKYGVANRAWRGLIDCFGVRWIKSRALHYEVDGVPQNDGIDH